jgi:hypothetical protein
MVNNNDPATMPPIPMSTERIGMAMQSSLQRSEWNAADHEQARMRESIAASVPITAIRQLYRGKCAVGMGGVHLHHLPIFEVAKQRHTSDQPAPTPVRAYVVR